METFLQEVSKRIIKSNYSLKDTILILPNKRAGLYLSNILSKELKTSSILPEILSIEDFIIKLSGKSKISKQRLILEFYNIYKLNTPFDETDSFDNFISWAQTLLKDFDDIDSNLINVDEIFNSLISFEEIGSWNNENKLNKKFTENFWKRLPQYYKSLKRKYKEIGFGSIGFLYREVINDLNIYLDSTEIFHFFIGFNALNKAENFIFQEFIESKKCEIYWDIDTYFYKDKNHSSSFFIKSYLKDWKYYRENSYDFFSNNYISPKKIKIIGLPQDIAQAKFIGKEISNNNKETSTNTVIVLGDQNLLTPLLSGLDNKSNDINVTMGLPFSNNSLAIFFQVFINFHSSFKNEAYYFSNTIELLKSDLIKSLFKKNFNYYENVTEHIKKNNVEFVSSEKLILKSNKKESFLSRLLFMPFEESNLFIERCLKLIDLASSLLNSNSIYRNKLESIFIRIKNLFKINRELKSITVFKYFFDDLLSDSKIQIKGSAFNGIQIMGLLESRVLDFENVIVTNLNEGILPLGKNDFSFLPFELKKNYEIPTFHENDLIYTYHFYRLLHRAKNIILTFNSSNIGIKGSERSRFLYQLEHDGLESHRFIKEEKSPKVNLYNKFKKEIRKSKEILNCLIQISKKGFSASSISQYLHDPINFYNERILKIKASEKFEKTINAIDKGSIVHDTLEDLYRPYQKKLLKIENLKNMILKVEPTLLKKFNETYNNKDINGQNKLVLKTLKKLIIDFLKNELNLINSGHEIKIIDIEKPFDYNLRISKSLPPIKLVGKIDRIDIFDGEIRIIDYKTGIIKSGNMVLKNFDQLRENHTMAPLFQLLLYSLVSKDTFDKGSKVKAVIISLREQKNYCKELKYTVENQEKKYLQSEVLIEFEEFLKKIFSELFDLKTPFV